jgi:hypothetical protein
VEGKRRKGERNILLTSKKTTFCRITLLVPLPLISRNQTACFEVRIALQFCFFCCSPLTKRTINCWVFESYQILETEETSMSNNSVPACAGHCSYSKLIQLLAKLMERAPGESLAPQLGQLLVCHMARSACSDSPSVPSPDPCAPFCPPRPQPLASFPFL